MVFSHLKKIEFSKLFGSADCVSKISKYNHDNEDDENHIFFSFTYTILRVIENFKIILINNGGGGIFRILPGHDETPVFNTFFETSHCLTAEHLCKMYGLDYLTASNETMLEERLKILFSNDDKPTLLEVFTPTLENNKVLLQYFNELV